MRTSVVCVLAFAVVLTVAVAGTGIAGDGSVYLYPEEERRSVTAGEKVQIDVIVSYDGTVYGDGLERITLAGTYNDSFLSVSDVEPRGWFETADADGEVVTSVDADESGRFNVSQHLDPAGGGVVGTEYFLTLTFEVEENAPATNTTVDFGESSVTIAGGFPSPVFETNPKISIEETADGDGAAGSEGSGRSEADETGGFPVPPALTLGLVAVLIGAVVAVFGRP